MTRIQLRRDVTADWETADTVLAPGEAGVELPAVPGTPCLLKVGDGTSPWSTLPYVATGGGGGGESGPITIADLPAGMVVDVEQNDDETWPDRPTARTDIRINWLSKPDSVVIPSGGLGRDSYVHRVSE